MSTKRFRIAFSFAGEKRDFVKQVADRLADRFTREKILYDKYHEAEFANADLAFDLPSLYKMESDLIVAVFCKEYDKKEWCGLEWRAIFSIIKEGGSKRVMPSRYDYVDGKGLHGLSGFIELDYKTPDEFATLILERLALNENQPKDYYTTTSAITASAPRLVIPHNLPALQPFFGRETELKTIADALDPDSRTWGALIDGPGGMGKTSLAVRAAYDAASNLFDRIIFISLKSRELDDNGLRDLSSFLVSGLVELFGELARELRREDVVKVAEDLRPRLLLEALRGTRTLLVLDNLESLIKPERDVLFTFVRKIPAGCKAILTSRGRIGTGAEELVLEKLDERAALDTLAELATHNPSLARTSEAERRLLYRETGGKPLLLRWIAGQIGRGHCLTFQNALGFLRSCPTGNDPLEFIFGDLLEDFFDAEIQVLCALSYFTMPVRFNYVAVNAALDDSETDRILRSLVNRSLVVATDEFTTFSLVPMVADFLRKKKPEVIAAIGDRLEQRAYALIVENGYDKYKRFPMLEAAWPGIAPALSLFIVGDNHLLQTVCDALLQFLNFQGRWDERLALNEKAEARALAAGDYNNAGWRAKDAGYIHYLRKQSDAVLACAERATAHWVSANAGAREMAEAIRLRGLGYRLKREYPIAIAAFQEALELYKSIVGSRPRMDIFLNSLAGAEQDFGDYPSAEAHYKEALAVARAACAQSGIATYTGNLAALALIRKDWQTAEALAREALPLATAVHRQELIASNNGRIAEAIIGQGRNSEAVAYAERAVEIYVRLDHPDLDRARAVLANCNS